MCIICFLNERKQYLLRHSASIRTDRFEHSLKIYKDEFIDEFKKSKNTICKIHKNSQSNQYINDALEKIKIEDVEDFFDKIKQIYIYWINTKIPDAISELEKLLTKINYERFDEELKETILFRGRFSSSFISHWDMFHIPFNRRFLITNQRYSLVGQPILYFATSPYGVYKELGDNNNLRVARFRIKDKASFKIFQNINKFPQYIEAEQPEMKQCIKSYNLDSMVYSMLNSEELSDEKYVQSMFYLMILSSCCSFSRRDDTADKEFAEEYVLPQILTIVLKQNGYEGIKYTSTKINKDKYLNIRNNRVKNMLYSNYCIFTNYTEKDSESKKNVYDRKLYEKFDISNVLSYDNEIDSELFKIEKNKKIVSNIDEMEYDNIYNKNMAYILAQDIDVILELSKSLKNNNNGKNKIIYNFINMHILFIRDVLLEIESKGRYKDGEKGI